MANKYYWLKLKRDFFRRHDIRIIEEMPNGKDYVLFYLKLLLESIDHDGVLRFSDTIPYNENMLSVVTNTNVDIVRAALNLFVELGLVSVFDDKTIYMQEVEKMIGSESKWASKKRIQRGQSEDNVLKMSSKCPQNVLADVGHCPTEIDIEIDIEKDIEKEERKDIKESAPAKPTRHKHGLYSNVLLSDEELEKLKAEFPADWQERIERLSEYIASHGKHYNSHLATIRSWARKDNKNKNVGQDLDDPLPF